MGRIRAGKLDRRVTFLRAGAGVDDGFTVQPGADAALGTRWASVMPERARERLQAMGLEATQVLNIWVRRDSLTETITERDKVQYRGRVHEIVAMPTEVGREGYEILVVGAD